MKLKANQSVLDNSTQLTVNFFVLYCHQKPYLTATLVPIDKFLMLNLYYMF